LRRDKRGLGMRWPKKCCGRNPSPNNRVADQPCFDRLFSSDHWTSSPRRNPLSFRHNSGRTEGHLAEQLAKIRRRLMLSPNDTPDVRRIFKGLRVREAQLLYAAQRQTGERFTELLIMNFSPGDPPH